MSDLDALATDFPSFSEGLSLRGLQTMPRTQGPPGFPFLFGGTFIEGPHYCNPDPDGQPISLPFRRDFH